jgi:MFS transporter, MCT family, solute carrier family 16 (monocarboxylic acid transporters), member 14
VSALSNRYGFRVVTIMGAILGSISLAVSVFATSIEFLYISIGVVGGIGFGLVYVPAVVAVGYYFDKRRALATGIAVCGSGVGTFVIAPLTTWLLEQYGWRGTILMLVIIFFRFI